MTMAGSTTRSSLDEQSSHGLLNTGDEKHLLASKRPLSRRSLLMNFVSFALGGSAVAVIMTLLHNTGSGIVSPLDTIAASYSSLNGNASLT